ncbi:SusC/RagA family TonB-linked outer membrane protein [Emticicia sp. 17c]|uniref:SusC/RagA family TonB-linked outer membrane protein n=1 Tax=Emticicia sp. 17c TaxID=3127704 RepID=UPI00301BD655
MKQNYFVPIRGALICGLLWIMSIVAFAQKSVSGKVSDSKGEGIPGASVSVKGTTAGTISDAEGNFKINVPNSGGRLVVSSIGYKTVELALSGQSVINVTLEDDASSLDEVVVTGYTIDSRRETTGSVSTVKTKDLSAVPSGNVEQQLQGKVAGVTVITNGQPGTASQVRVRGFGAFGGNEPLYVVDGVPMGNTEFLNPDDIETTTVLKDAASASIYGARAANGVIIYTTKKGKKGAKKLSITYDGLYGATLPGPGQKMMNPQDFADWTWNAKRNSGEPLTHPQFGTGATPVIPDYINVGGRSGVIGTVDLAAEKLKYNVNPAAGPIYQVVKANKAGTDWYKEITRVAPMHRHTLGFSGGGDRSRFYFGLAAQQQGGVMIYNQFNRYSLRANSEFDVFKNVRIGENFQLTYREVLGQQGDEGGKGVADDENEFLAAFRMPSIIPVYDEFGGYAGTAAKGFNNPRNPVAARDGIKNNRGFNMIGSGNVYVEYDPIPGLTLRSNIGTTFSNQYYWNYSRLQYENSENNSAFGYGEGARFGFGWTFTNTANYKKKFGKHGIDLLAGQEALNTGKGRNIDATGQNPFSTDLDYITMTTVGSRIVNSGYDKGVNFYSLFARANYSFNDKYLLSATIRRDGSSRFGINNRYGVFPAFSAAWRISSESFMKALPWINDLKIRGGYGLMGNSNNVNPNNQFSLYGTNIGESVYDINGTNSSVAEGYYRTRIGNPDAKWETSITKNLGFDGSFFNGKLDVIFELWQKDTKDLLTQLPITQTAGYRATAPLVNIGKMVNKGIDFQVINRGKIHKEVGYEINLTGSFLDNKIVSIAPGLTYLTNINPGYRNINPIRNQLGYSLSSFYGYKVVGLFRDKAEVDAAPAQDGKAPGRFRYADINGDNKIDDADRTYLGSPVPKFTGGLNLTFTYKNFDLSTYLYTSIGNKIFNVSKLFTDFYPTFSGAAISERVKDSWTPTNLGATIPIFESYSGFSSNTQSNSFYIEDGSYLRMQNIAIGYTLPGNLVSKWKMERLRIYAAANNLFTITKYQGLDPGVGGNADTQFGIDLGNAPITPGWNVGLNIGF